MNRKELDRRRKIVTDAFHEATTGLSGPDLVEFVDELEADIEGWRMLREETDK